MLNHFVASLDNDPTPPEGFIWPEFEPRQLSDEQAAFHRLLVGAPESGRQLRFLRAMALTYLTEQSVLNFLTVADDPRKTYHGSDITHLFDHPQLSVTQPEGQPKATIGFLAMAPDVGSWRVTMQGSSAIVADDSGRSITTALVLEPGGLTNPAAFPGEAGYALFNGVPDSGAVYHIQRLFIRQPWVDQLLQIVPEAPPADLPEHLRPYWAGSPRTDDRLAILVAYVAGDLNG